MGAVDRGRLVPPALVTKEALTPSILTQMPCTQGSIGSDCPRFGLLAIRPALGWCMCVYVWRVSAPSGRPFTRYVPIDRIAQSLQP